VEEQTIAEDVHSAATIYAPYHQNFVLKNAFRKNFTTAPLTRPASAEDLQVTGAGQCSFRGTADGYLVLAGNEPIAWTPRDGDAHFAPEHEIAPGLTLLFITDVTSFEADLPSDTRHIAVVPFNGGGGNVLYGKAAHANITLQ
jgi:hypothetical protein